MNLSRLIQKWSALDETSQIVIVTDDVQESIAYLIKEENLFNVRIEYFSKTIGLMNILKDLKESDLVILLLSQETFINDGANNYFSPFYKPNGISAKYIFIRLDISEKSLIEGLSTEKMSVYNKIDSMNRLKFDKYIRVTNQSGTDISFKTLPFSTCSHEITKNGGNAFLPPSETSAEIITNTANGKIVVDITVGQLYSYGKLIGRFGLVEKPIVLTINDGIITDIQGDGTAVEVKEKLFNLPYDCRKIVELGQGLSSITPTGLIGVDESIINSCHFGFGDAQKCGTHLDMVISSPTIEQIY